MSTFLALRKQLSVASAKALSATTFSENFYFSVKEFLFQLYLQACLRSYSSIYRFRFHLKLYSITHLNLISRGWLFYFGSDMVLKKAKIKKRKIPDLIYFFGSSHRFGLTVLYCNKIFDKKLLWHFLSLINTFFKSILKFCYRTEHEKFFQYRTTTILFYFFLLSFGNKG